MEQLHVSLREQQPHGGVAHFIFRSHGRKEDRELELKIYRIAANDIRLSNNRQDFGLFVFQPVFVPKAANSTGLQLADLTARSIALSHLHPNQPDRAI